MVWVLKWIERIFKEHLRELASVGSLRSPPSASLGCGVGSKVDRKYFGHFGSEEVIKVFSELADFRK